MRRQRFIAERFEKLVAHSDAGKINTCHIGATHQSRRSVWA
jgi:hypothetical protein